jgi:predicted nucleotidyltransferase
MNPGNDVAMTNQRQSTVNGLLEAKRDKLARLCRQYHVRRLELFGSATGANFEPDTSDFDFLVEFEDLVPEEHANAFFGLMHTRIDCCAPG